MNGYMRHERRGTYEWKMVEWKVVGVGWVSGKRKRKPSHGEENVDERCV